VANVKMGRTIAALLILVAAILMVVAIVVPWYTVGASGDGLTENANYYAGLSSQNGTIQHTCSGVPRCDPSSSYSSADYNNTGNIAETGFFLLIGGFVLGIIAAILGLASRGNSRRATPAMALAIIALILALVAPVLFAVALPGAINKDLHSPSGSGPWGSFIGTGSTPIGGGITLSTSWGPAIGWYLSIVAFVLFLVGVILLARARKEPPAAPVTQPMMGQDPSMMPPPASPPPT